MVVREIKRRVLNGLQRLTGDRSNAMYDVDNWGSPDSALEPCYLQDKDEIYVYVLSTTNLIGSQSLRVTWLV